MPLVKLTMFQDEREIPEDEIPVLRAQGLVESVRGEENPPAPSAPTE